MELKEYLKQTLKLQSEIDALKETQEAIRSQAEKATTTLDPNKVSGSFNVHNREDIIVKMLDLQGEIGDKVDQLLSLQQDIFNLIYSLEDGDYRTLLMLRYINLKSFEEIAVEMNYSYRHVIRMHGWALQELGKTCPTMSYKKGVR